MRKLSTLRGFTLIEIVIVVALIAILSLGATLAYGKFTDSARNNSAISAGKSLQDAINIKAAQNGTAAGAVAYDSTSTGNPVLVAPLAGDYTVTTGAVAAVAPTTGPPATAGTPAGTLWTISRTGGVTGTDYKCTMTVGTTDQLANTASCVKM